MTNSRDREPPWRRRQREEVERAALNQRVAEASKQDRQRKWREWVALGLGIVSAVASVAVLIIWKIEQSDRDLGRKVARNQIVQDAREVLAAYSTREVVEVSPELVEAMSTLAKEGEWIWLSAKKEIRFWDLRLPCGGYVLLAPSIEFLNAEMDQSHFLMNPNTLSIYGSKLRLTDFEFDSSLTSFQPFSLQVAVTSLEHSSIDTGNTIAAISDTTFRYSDLDVGGGNGLPDVKVRFETYRLGRTFIWTESAQDEGFAADAEKRDYLDGLFATAPASHPSDFGRPYDEWKNRPLSERAPLASPHRERCKVSTVGYNCVDPNLKIEMATFEKDAPVQECKKLFPLDRRRY